MNLYYEHPETLIVDKAAISHDSQTNNRSDNSQMFFKIGVLIEFVPCHDTGKTAKEMMMYISAAITNKVPNILENEIFFSILSDGSQARKIKHDKEMVLIRTERKGIL